MSLLHTKKCSDLKGDFMIVITGAAGFIGSCLAKRLNELGRSDLLLVDLLNTDIRWKNLRNLKFEEILTPKDFLAQIQNKTLPKNIEMIFHMGACSATTEMDMNFLLDNNVNYSKEVFRFCTQNNIALCYASSAATYGAGEHDYVDSHEKIPQLLPLNPYGYSKQLFDEWVLKQSVTPSKWFGVKFFNVFGPNEYHKGKMRSVVHQAYEQIMAGQAVQLFCSYKEGFSDGEQKRDFVYVKDIVDAMILMLSQGDATQSGIYNLGTGEARSFNDLVKAVFSAMNQKENIHYIPMPENLKSQYQYFTEANMNKFSKNFPDFKFTSLEDAVKDYIQELSQ